MTKVQRLRGTGYGDEVTEPGCAPLVVAGGGSRPVGSRSIRKRWMWRVNCASKRLGLHGATGGVRRSGLRPAGAAGILQ